MSVIGRLDDQVEDVIISPLEKNRPKINPGPAENPVPDESAESTHQEVNERVGCESLPVWLL
jgi:hypothetical protein